MKHKDDYASKIFVNKPNTQKEEEKEIVKNFLKRVELEYENIIEYERPDFIIELPNDYNIGCEVTTFYSDTFSSNKDKGKKFLSEWKRFAQKLRVKLLEKNESYKYIYGVIHFQTKGNVNSLIYNDSFIDELIYVVDNNYENIKNPSDYLDISSIDYDLPLTKKNVDKIYLKNVSSKDLLWFPAHLQSGLMPNSQETLENIIKIKNKKANQYKKDDLDHKWLLILAEGHALNDICIAEPLKQEIIDSTSYFTRIFLHNKFPDDEIIQVYPEYKIISSSKSKNINSKYLP